MSAGAIQITDLRFVYDSHLIGETGEEFQELTNRPDTTRRRQGMQINKDKCTVTVIYTNSEEVKLTTNVEDHPLEQVKSFKYIGSTNTVETSIK